MDIKLKFPKKFLWGAATAAHQVEGGTHNQWTVWELENARDRANQAQSRMSWYKNWKRVEVDVKDPDNYVSGKLADHFKRYSEDFDFLRQMNMNAYRFSIEWSRLEQECGVWDVKAFSYYRGYIEELQSLGIEPILTMFHFTLPVWFAEMGGFEKRSNVKYFTRFIEKAMNEIGVNVKYIITINEPEVYTAQSYLMQDWPPNQKSPLKTFLVLNNLITAHNKSAKIIKRIKPSCQVSIAKHSTYFFAGDDSWISKACVKVYRYIWDDYFIIRTRRNLDFLGVNYYQSTRICGLNVCNNEKNVSDLDWPMTPADIQFVVERLYTKYRLPIIVTENGLADSLDKKRKWWITETLIALNKAMRNGVKLHGYLHWSLMDNFEWAFGKWPRFGLVEVDYSTGKRKLRSSAKWFGRAIQELRNK